MKKTDKKLDNQICQALTKACEVAKNKVQGFQWLTHHVNYQQFPGSLSIICIFDTNAELEDARRESKDQLMLGIIKSQLTQININLKEISQHVLFDTEEARNIEHNGKWQKRIN